MTARHHQPIIRAANLAAVLSLFVGASLRADDTPDALIERWDQSWTWRSDGSQVYEETRHVRLMHERAYGEFADPRITLDRENDSLEVLTARTRLADGTFVETPDYSRNEVSPGATAGWPAFSGIRQMVLTMSGVTPGCVVETSFRVVSRPGARGFLTIETPLDHRYPIASRTLSVNIPDGVQPRTVLVNLAKDRWSYTSAADPAGRTVTHRWRLRDLPGAVDEPQGPPWRLLRPRLVFCTLNDEDWLRTALRRVEGAAGDARLVADLARKWSTAAAPADRMRDLQQKLAATFNFVEFEPAWRPERIRPAAAVLRDNYGLPEEAAAALLALARAGGITAEASLIAGAELTDSVGDTVPRHGFAAADYAVCTFDGGARAFWSPRYGLIQPEGRWAGASLFLAHRDGTDEIRYQAPLSAEGNGLALRGRIALAADGKYSGRISLLATGIFVNSEPLRTPAAQRTRIEDLLRRLLPDVSVEKFAVTQLSCGRFEADVDVLTAQPLAKVDAAWRLTLAGDIPALLDVPMPLAPSTRTLPVRLAAAFCETVDLTIEWPSGCLAVVTPRGNARVGEWGEVSLRGAGAGAGFRFERTIRCATRDLVPADFAELQAAVNACRTEAARTLLLRP